MYPKYLLVMDFETTCDDPQPLHPPELIEFPIVVVDTESDTVVDEYRSFVKPSIHPQLTAYCTELTGITQKDVASAPSFSEILVNVQKWLTEKGYEEGLALICGDFDIDILLRQQCLTMQQPMPDWAARWCNMKVAFKDFYRQINSDRLDLSHMLEHCGLEHSGTPDCGIDDARSLAQIVLHMLKMQAPISANSNGRCPRCGAEVALSAIECRMCNATWVKMEPGDWLCPQCNTTNYSHRTACFNCKRPRTNETMKSTVESIMPEPQMKPGDWLCPSCNKLNFARRSVCMECNTPKPGGGDAPYSGGGGGGRTEQRDGDWNCPDCNASNFARRTSCFRCGARKPASAGGGQGGFARRSGGSGNDNPGDWTCSGCGESNFARRNVCYRCERPKPSNY